jgi:23S rRNA (adenine2503-C2)-methyltransferase
MLASHLEAATQIEPVRRVLSTDGTVKLSFLDKRGLRFETCLLNLEYRMVPRVVCVSTQVGCPFDCSFCSVGSDPLIRSLTCDEIFAQVFSAMRDSFWDGGQGAFEIAAMGTGEPMCALDGLIDAVRISKETFPELISLNVATVGVPDGIRRYSQIEVEGIDINLQLSLHGSSDEQREMLMPLASRFGLGAVLKACEDFAMRRQKRVLANYLLIDGVNDTAADAFDLCRLLDPRYFTIKLSILNPAGVANLRGSQADSIHRFRNTLWSNGFSEARVFTSCGKDIGAGCGQFSNSPF